MMRGKKEASVSVAGGWWRAFVSCSSSPRRALMWIIKCKLPGVICHVARRAQGVSNSEQMLLSTSPAKRKKKWKRKKKKIFHVGHSFLCCCRCQMAKFELRLLFFFMKRKKQKQNTFPHVLIAPKRGNNEGAECRGAAQVALDHQLSSRLGSEIGQWEAGSRGRFSSVGKRWDNSKWRQFKVS